ncbi:hypothetical protein ACFS07_09400 [Undibacterium arcticum]
MRQISTGQADGAQYPRFTGVLRPAPYPYSGRTTNSPSSAPT